MILHEHAFLRTDAAGLLSRRRKNSGSIGYEVKFGWSHGSRGDAVVSRSQFSSR